MIPHIRFFQKLILLCVPLSIPMLLHGAEVQHVSSEAFAAMVDANPGTLLDVRTQQEFGNGHLPDSGQLDYYADDFRERLLLLPREVPIYLYCNTGYRSRKAARFLQKNGYEHIYNLKRGIMEWRFKRLPVVAEPDASPDLENKMNLEEFNALIQSDRPVWIDFYAPWCGPCRQLMPIFDALADEFGEAAVFVKINADSSAGLMEELGIIGVPHVANYHQGELQFEHSGMLGAQALRHTIEDSIARSLEQH